MKKHYFILLIIPLALCLGLLGFFVYASTLNTADTFGVLGSTVSDTSGATFIFGSAGWTTPPATIPTVSGTIHVADGAYNQAGIDQGTALATLNAMPCDFSFVGATDLSLLVQPLPVGVYCTTGAQSVGTGGITLLSGTYVFRSTGALNTVANSVVSGGDACDVYWTGVATTLGANSTFRGTVIDPAGITVGSTVSWLGRALSFGGTITTDTDTITVPTCTVPTPTPTPSPTPTTTPSVSPIPTIVPALQGKSGGGGGGCTRYWSDGTPTFCYIEYLKSIAPTTSPTPTVTPTPTPIATPVPTTPVIPPCVTRDCLKGA